MRFSGWESASSEWKQPGVIFKLVTFILTINHCSVLENNSGLLERDYADFAPYFAAMGVTVAKSDFSTDADIVYCLRKDIERLARDRAFRGCRPFVDTVLIADEVDEREWRRATLIPGGHRPYDLSYCAPCSDRRRAAQPGVRET